MRLRSWTVRVGPLIVAAAFTPTVLGALWLSAPGTSGEVAVGAPPAGSSAPAPQAEPPSLVPDTELDQRTTANAPDALPPLSCTPLRGLPEQGLAAPPVTVEGLLGSRGEHIGRRIGLRSRRGVEVSVTLPADSFVGQPSGDWLVYGTAGRRDSELRAIDLETGCDVRLARIEGVARGAILDATGSKLYVHALEARGRRDLGLTRIDLGSGDAEPVLPPFEPTADFGPVFSTSLSWSVDGGSLAVQSCGAEGCHTRLVNPSTGDVATYAEEHGSLVLVTRSHLIAFAAGHARPVPLLAIDRAGGTARVLVDEAYEAVVIGTADAPALRVDTPTGWQEVAP